MIVWFSRSLIALVAACATLAWGASNPDIVALSKAGVGDEVIIATIAKEACGYSLQPKELAALRKAGVSSRVIATMILKCDNPSQSNEGADVGQTLELRPGVYAVESGEGRTRYSLMVPAIVAKGRAGGNGSLLMPDRSRITLPGVGAPPIATRRPIFWIVHSSSSASVSKSSAGGELQGFENLRLVRLERKSDRRQLEAGSSANGFIMSGIEAKRIIPIQVQPKAKLIHEVSVDRDMEPGEYALLTSGTAETYRLYDFSIP